MAPARYGMLDNVLCAQEIVVALPELLGPIQAQLLDLVSVVLAGRSLRDSLPQPLLQALHLAVQHGKPAAKFCWNTGNPKPHNPFNLRDFQYLS